MVERLIKDLKDLYHLPMTHTFMQKGERQSCRNSEFLFFAFAIAPVRIDF
jgi:hypothetical protein